MFAAYVVIYAGNAALKDRKTALNCVSMYVSMYISTGTVTNKFMAPEHVHKNAILAVTICHNRRFLCIFDMRIKDWAERLCGHNRDMVRANVSAAFYQRENCFLPNWAAVPRVMFAAMFVALATADVRSIRFDEFALAAD